MLEKRVLQQLLHLANNYSVTKSHEQTKSFFSCNDELKEIVFL